LSKALSAIERLDECSLHLAHCPKLTDEGFYDIAKVVSELRDLTALKFDLKDCPKISDKSLKTLGSMFASGSSMQVLTHFDLNVSGCPKVSDEGALSLIKKLNYLESITFLELEFNQCSKVSGQALTLLGSSILKLHHRCSF